MDVFPAMAGPLVFAIFVIIIGCLIRYCKQQQAMARMNQSQVVVAGGANGWAMPSGTPGSQPTFAPPPPPPPGFGGMAPVGGPDFGPYPPPPPIGFVPPADSNAAPFYPAPPAYAPGALSPALPPSYEDAIKIPKEEAGVRY